MSEETLKRLLEKGDKSEVRKFFQGMPENERRRYAATALANLKAIKKNRMIEESPGRFVGNKLLPAAELAFFETATFAEIQKIGMRWTPGGPECLQVLTERRPDWVSDFAEALLNGTYYWGSWDLVRSLIKEGLISKPDHPHYYLGMLEALGGRYAKGDLQERFEAEPDLLDDIWKLFEYDGGGEISLANVDRFTHRTSWSGTMLELMKKKKLPRAKLLDCTVSALERDFNHYRARWFFTFFDMLEPTPKELAGFASRIIGLLNNTAPNVVAWAFEKVQGLVKLHTLDTADVIRSMEPVLRSRNKGIVLDVLKLIRHLATDVKSKSASADVVFAALQHEKPDVQNKALDLLSSLGPLDGKTQRSLQDVLPGLAASVRKRAEAMCTVPSMNAGRMKQAGSKSKSGAGSTIAQKLPSVDARLKQKFSIDQLEQNLKKSVFEIPPARFDGTDLLRLNVAEPVSPILDVEELIDTCLKAVEDGSQTVDVERCLDGIAELCDSLPENFDTLAAPLLKRVRQKIRKEQIPFEGKDPSADLCGVVYALCTGVVLKARPDRDQDDVFIMDLEGNAVTFWQHGRATIASVFSRLCREVAERVAKRESQRLLSTPTHAGGWVSVSTLADRIRLRGNDGPGRYDVILAMLRLAPDNRSKTLKALPKETEWQQAVRYACGADDVKVGTTAAIWAVAAAARSPREPQPKIAALFADELPDAGHPAGYELQLVRKKPGQYVFFYPKVTSTPPAPKKCPVDLPTVLLHSSRTADSDGAFAGNTDGSVRWCATIWPLHRESYFAGAIEVCLNNLDWHEADWHNRCLLEPLFDPGTPLSHNGLLLLVGVLAAKEPGESGLAVDAAIQCIEDGRLGSSNLGHALSVLMAQGFLKPGRLQKTLSQVAGVSVVHAAVVLIALQHAIVCLKDDLPKDTAKLLELLLELCVEHTFPLSDNFLKCLEDKFTSGKGRQLAAGLKQASENASTDSVTQVLQDAISKRCHAASRFNKS
ncbi:MAG: hypothetical protein JNM43_20675 [Planctomycetaceae bacterium]|nr:hypothetical protein [Planctomycetaceae bacterium]